MEFNNYCHHDSNNALQKHNTWQCYYYKMSCKRKFALLFDTMDSFGCSSCDKQHVQEANSQIICVYAAVR